MPLGGAQQIALFVPLLTFAIGVAYLRGAFTIDRRRLVIVAILAGAASLITLVQVVVGLVPSILSVVLLIVLYLPAVLTPRGDLAAWRRIALFFVRVMSVAAVVAIVQFGLQSAGVAVPDVLGQVVPKAFVLQDFNTGNAIQYGSTVDRANAFVFLEPSFLSLFLGLAILVALQLRLKWPTMTLLLAGIAPTVAGNGIILILSAVVVFAVRDRRALLSMVPAVVLAVVALAVTPLGALFVQRSTEGGGTNSSTGLRFVQPYIELLPPPLANPLSALIGRGAGSAATYITSHDLGALLATPLPKVLFELGLLGVVGVLLPLLLLFVEPLRRQPEQLGLVFSFFVANASLQSSVMVYPAILFLLWLPDLSSRRRTPSWTPTDAGPSPLRLELAV